MRLLSLLLPLSLLPLVSPTCCTPQCCCTGCSSCNNPITDTCNSYSCTYYSAGGNCGAASRLFQNGQIHQHHVGATNYQPPVVSSKAGCQCNGQQVAPQPVTSQCICPDNSVQGTYVAVHGFGTKVLHKDTCYGYEYCLLGLPGWVTIVCSILLLLIVIILLFYCISCLIHFFII